MLNVAIENQNGWNYSASAPHKTGAGICTPMMTIAHNRAQAVFLCVMHSHIQIMVRRAGQPKGWPVPMVSGSANPVRLTTHEICTSGGELLKLTIEAAIMATIPALSHPDVIIENGRAVTTSVAVAEFFHKRHHHVVQKIESLECSEQFLTRNFSRVKFEHRGNSYNAYQITKNGFVFLVMGFTGKKAAAFKEAYIAEFDRMENELRQQKSSQVCNDVIHGDGRTLLIRLDEHGNIKFTRTVPDNACVCTLDTFRFYLEQQGWTLVNRNTIKNMTVEQLLCIK
ncbi:transcriptional regulator [Salmonella enterica subsp. enterica serovar Stanley]|nr:transcriptional regulator [Salmonella enterica]EBP0844386.1 transcriptional regulator [Salmonella enterica]ECD2576503.1 transcriptional regulator [Salmonella enterica subsp. enterica serovar Stanley]